MFVSLRALLSALSGAIALIAIALVVGGGSASATHVALSAHSPRIPNNELSFLDAPADPSSTATPMPTPGCIARWDRVPSPGPIGLSGLSAISIVSAGDIWAVGYYRRTTTSRGLTL